MARCAGLWPSRHFGIADQFAVPDDRMPAELKRAADSALSAKRVPPHMDAARQAVIDVRVAWIGGSAGLRAVGIIGTSLGSDAYASLATRTIRESR